MTRTLALGAICIWAGGATASPLRARESSLPSATASLLSASVSAPDRAASSFRMRVLSLVDRTSLVVELDESPVDLKQNRVNASTLVVEVGPVAESGGPHEFKPEAGVPLLYDVSIGQPTQPRRIRLRLRFREGCQVAVRTVGRRIYIDLDGGGTALAAGPREPRVAQDRSAADLTALGYQQLAAPVAGAAAALAKRPDINGLLALRTRVVERDAELGHGAPELISRVLADIDQRLDEARRLRLKLDAMEFERLKGSSRR